MRNMSTGIAIYCWRWRQEEVTKQPRFGGVFFATLTKIKKRGGEQVADNYEQYSREELLPLLRERDRKPKFGLVWERNEIEHDKSLNDDFVALDLVLDFILVAFPNLIRQVARECAAQYAELMDASALPDSIELPSGARTSRLNVYSVMPPDLNRDEMAFAEMLDSDLSGTVEWWHRNEPRKPWSIGLILPNGAQYFPDFVVKVNGRTLGDGLLLAETKGDHLLNSSDTLDKVLVSHKLYKHPVMLMREDSGRFMTIRQDANGKNSPDQIFRLDLMVGY